MACLRKVQVTLEICDPSATAAFKVDVVGCDRTENITTTSRSCNQYIQASFAAVDTKRAEVHGHVSAFISGVADRNKNYVPFVPLDILQILDEEWFVWMCMEEIFNVAFGTS